MLYGTSHNKQTEISPTLFYDSTIWAAGLVQTHKWICFSV